MFCSFCVLGQDSIADPSNNIHMVIITYHRDVKDLCIYIHKVFIDLLMESRQLMKISMDYSSIIVRFHTLKVLENKLFDTLLWSQAEGYCVGNAIAHLSISSGFLPETGAPRHASHLFNCVMFSWLGFFPFREEPGISSSQSIEMSPS